MNYLHLFFGIDPLIFERSSDNEKSKFYLTYFFLIFFFFLNVLLSIYISNNYLENFSLSFIAIVFFFIILFNLLKISIFNVPSFSGRSIIKRYINLETLVRVVIYSLASIICSFVIFTSIYKEDILKVNKSTDKRIYESLIKESDKQNVKPSGLKLILASKDFNHNSTHFHIVSISKFCYHNSFFRIILILVFFSFVLIQWNMYDLKNNQSNLYYSVEREFNQGIIDRDKIKTQEYVNQMLHDKYNRNDLEMNLFKIIIPKEKNKISIDELISI